MDENNPSNSHGNLPILDKVVPRVIEQEMKEAYVNYAMSVIVGRALPDVKDGLKPVHRRILYAMYDMGILHNKSFKKCARIVGEVLGKYHPHGDTAVYDSLVRMAQDFSLRYPLIKGQGNFGSIDGDSAAAMRYCVTGDTLVVTDKGLVPIEEISHKEEEDIDVTVLNYEGKKVKASKFFNSGQHEIIEIVTEQGYKLRGSFNHPVLCWEMGKFQMPTFIWKWISDVTPYDYVLLNRNFSLFNRDLLSLKPYFPICSKKEKKITLPSSIKSSLAFLLGALVAEGSFHQDKILFNNKDRDFYNQVKESVLENFPEVVLYEREIKGDCKEFELYHQQAVKFLINIGLKKVKSHLKEVPQIIFKSKKEIIREFLKALFEGDGSVQLVKDKRHSGKSIQLTYDSKSETLIQQLKVLLLNFGIVTGAPYLDKRKGCYKLIIPGAANINIFRQKIGFYSHRKQSILDSVKVINTSRMSKTDYIPLLNTYLRRNYQEQFIQKNNFDRYNNLEKNRTKLETILHPLDKNMVDWLLKKKYLFNRVRSVQKLEKKETVYSLRVDNSCHSFVANGFINHNTEAKLQKLAESMLQDIEKETVPFKDNFDGSLKEPEVLPTVIPNLLVNGSSGIAVGMATNIPPHNVQEVCDGVIATIDNPNIDLQELMSIIPAPDFPTGGEILCGSALQYAYLKGRGKLQIKSVVETEQHKLIIKEIPYMVNKAEMIEQIAQLVKDKRILGIRNINDESDREGIRVVIDLKHDADPQVILNQLYKYSRMKVSFGINLLALVDNQPKTLGLKDLIQHHIDHRKNVIVLRTKYDLDQAQKKVHILDGLLVALDNVDAVVQGIKASRTVDDARHFLMQTYALTEIQAKAILELRLQKLASLEQEKIKEEHAELLKMITYYQEVLSSEAKVLGLIKEELNDVKANFGDARRSKVTLSEDDDVDMEDLIEDEFVVVTMTDSGYMKRQPIDVYKTQKRGGKGVKAAATKEEDVVASLYIASTHDYLLCFTDQGQLYWLKVWQIPEASRLAKGKHIANVLEMKEGEKITAIVPVKNFQAGYLFMATKQGTVKKTELMDFANPRNGGIRAITLDEQDTLINVRYTDGNHEIILATKHGLANRFKEKDVRAMGRSARGVRGIRLSAGDEVIGMLAAEEGMNILTLTEKGYGKRTPVSEYRLCNRGGKGVTNIKITDKNGPVKTVMLVNGGEELMLVSQNGVGIRIRCSDISIIGRATQGVRIMRLNDGDVLAAAAKIFIEGDHVDIPQVAVAEKIGMGNYVPSDSPSEKDDGVEESDEDIIDDAEDNQEGDKEEDQDNQEEDQQEDDAGNDNDTDNHENSDSAEDPNSAEDTDDAEEDGKDDEGNPAP